MAPPDLDPLERAHQAALERGARPEGVDEQLDGGIGVMPAG